MSRAVLALFLSIGLVATMVRIRRQKSPEALDGFGKRETLPLRGILVMLVVLGHLVGEVATKGHPLAGLSWATPAVGVFFFLSGYGLWKSYSAAALEDRLAGYWRAFAARSAKRILPAFVIVAVIVILVRLAESGSFSWVRFAETAQGKVGWLVPHGWYVWTLVLFYGIYAVSFRFLGPKRGVVAIFCASFIYWIWIKYGLHWETYWWATIFAFPLGFVVSARERYIRGVVVSQPWMVCGCLVCSLLVSVVLRFVTGRRSILTQEAFNLIVCLSVFVCMMATDWLTRRHVLVFLGTISYELYLIHGIFEETILHWAIPLWASASLFLFASVISAWALRRFTNFQIFFSQC